MALALAPMASYGLGLGQIRSGSALNQPFQGDIDLLSVGAEEIHQVKVRLAPADAFQRAGVEMTGPVGRLAFKPYVRPNGQPAIRVTTADPVREPFLNFLIEVEWPQGKTTKEYTVLLDPPIFTERRGGRVRAAEATLPPVDAAPRERRPARATRTATASGERYTVRQGDTLWSIAERSKPKGVSTPEAVDLIYAANPDAFIRGDKNLVRAGADLRLPTPAELGAIDVQTARREYLEQAREPAAEPEQPVTAAGPAGAEPSAEASDRLRLVTAPPDSGMAGMTGMGATTGAEPSAATRQDLLLAQEKAESALQTAEQLQGRVSDLETQLRDMQRLLLLKDEQLAELQRQEGVAGMTGAEAPAAAEPAPAVPAAPEAGGAPPAEPPAEPAVTAAPTAAEAPATEAVATTAPAVPPPAATAEPAPVTEVKPVEVAPVEAKPAAPAMEEKPAAAEPPPAVAKPEPVAEAKKPEPVPPPVAEAKKPEPSPEGLAAILKEPTTLLGASAAIIALLGAWLLPIGSRRRKAEAAAAPAPVAPAAPAPKPVEPPPAAVAGPAERMEPAATAAAVAAAAGTTAAVAAAPRREPEPERVSTEDLAALELSTTDLFGLKGETTEVDPTEEADVYIAYGRYEQAEQLLRLALEMEPGRLALQHKLLEVYFAGRDASAYNALFSEMQTAGREVEDPAAWQRALRMGRQIDPDNPVYAGTAQDERDLEAALREAEEGLAADLKAGGDDLDTLKIDTRFSESAADIDSGSVLNDLSLDLGTEEAGDKASHPFRLDVSEELEQMQKGGTGLAGELDESDLAKAGGLGAFAMEDMTPEQLEQDEDRAPDLSGIELTIDSGTPEQDTTLMHADTTLELVDDVETKLDLARAYIELGDTEGARGMLEEVLQEGNDAQKANAQTMLKELG